LRAWYQALYTSLNVRWERQAFADARVIVAVSDRIRAELIDAGVSPDRICVIPNGVDPTEFAPGPVPRDALGLPSHVPLALFVGDLQTPRKNLDTVLRALVDVPTLHLAVAGRIDDSPYPSLASTLGLGDRVHFLDFRRDVPALMRAADFTVAPSRYEPFSLVVLESLASERPVITTQNVGAASLLNADCGVVLDDPEDTDALAAALSLLTNAPQRREQMGKVGRAVALQYTWDEIAARYVSLLESMHAPDEVSDERIPSTRAPRPISIH
jgi:glycosyltransferase involved in cell wall biosynthesis